MPSSPDITRTEQRIAEIDALQQTIEQLQQDLQLYREALRRELELLHEEPVGTPAQALEPAANDEPVDAATDSIGNLDEMSFRDLDAGASNPDEEIPMVGSSSRSPFELEEAGEKLDGKPVSVMISDATISEEPLSGWVLERPPGGLKILVDDEIQLGKVIMVRPTRDHPDAQWINVSVKSSKPERSSFIIVCQFVERPPWKALAQFNG